MAPYCSPIEHHTFRDCQFKANCKRQKATCCLKTSCSTSLLDPALHPSFTSVLHAATMHTILGTCCFKQEPVGSKGAVRSKPVVAALSGTLSQVPSLSQSQPSCACCSPVCPAQCAQCPVNPAQCPVPSVPRPVPSLLELVGARCAQPSVSFSQ